DLGLRSPIARELNGATARALRAVSTLLGDGSSGRPAGRTAAADLAAALAELHRDRRASLRWAVDRLVHNVTQPPPSPDTDEAAAAALALLHPTFQARTLGLATEDLGGLALEAAGYGAPAAAASQPGHAAEAASRPGRTARALWRRAAAHLTLRSVWL